MTANAAIQNPTDWIFFKWMEESIRILFEKRMFMFQLHIPVYITKINRVRERVDPF